MSSNFKAKSKLYLQKQTKKKHKMLEIGISKTGNDACDFTIEEQNSHVIMFH